MTPSLRARRLRANGALLLASALWGFAFVAQRIGAEHVDPFSFNAVRFALGAASLVPVIAFRDRRRGLSRVERAAATSAVLVPGLVTGSFLAAAIGLQQVAMAHTTASNAAFITGLYMVFVPAIAAVRGHRTSLATVVGIVSALAGLYLISVTERFTLGYGDALVLASTVLWAAHILVIEHYSRRLSVIRFATAQFVVCAGISAVAALLVDPAPFTGLQAAAIPIVYGGVVSVGIAYTLQVVGQRDALATHAALIMSAESVFGALGGALLLGENMGPRGYLGAALMLVGISVSQVGLPAKPLDDLTDRRPEAVA